VGNRYFEQLIHRGTRVGAKYAFINKNFCSSIPSLEFLILFDRDPCCHLSPRLVRAKVVCCNHQCPNRNHHGSQHTTSMSSRIVCLLRKARGCCGPIRSTPDPIPKYISTYIIIMSPKLGDMTRVGAKYAFINKNFCSSIPSLEFLILFDRDPCCHSVVGVDKVGELFYMTALCID
jgi:hypothetical protein